MPVRTFQEHIQSLLGRTVAEAKVAGAGSPDVEARAILDSIALTLLLKPKAVLYLAHLARNGLLKAVKDELALIAQMSKTVDDLGNVTFTTTNTTYLNKARNFLVQMEGLDKISAEESAFKKFDSSIDSFLDQALAKTVRKKGKTELSRPDTEAAADLPTDLASLKEAHSDTISRLYSLVVGVENFTSSPLGTILGLTTAFRARTDIEDIISLVEGGESGTQARDIAMRLLGSRAALKTVGTLPNLTASLIDTAATVPAGYSMRAQTDPAVAIATSSIGPFVFSAAAAATINVNGQVLTAAQFPQTGLDLANRAFVSGTALTFPLTVPVDSRFFLRLTRATAAAGYDLQPDGTYLKQTMVSITSGSRSLAQVLTDINTALGADGTAAEYVRAGTNRLIIVGAAAITKLSVESSMTVASSSTVGAPSLYTDTDHVRYGLTPVEVLSGSTPVQIVLDALNLRFATITAVQTPQLRIVVSSVADVPGTGMVITTDAVLGLNGTFNAQSDLLRLYGSVNGVVTDPIDPNPLVDVSDLISTPGGSTTIAGLSPTRMRLAAPLNTFDGQITVDSSLVAAHEVFDQNIQDFTTSWLDSRFAEDLTVLDRAVAVLSGSPTPASRNFAKTLLSDLSTSLTTLASALGTGLLPSESATDEKQLVTGIINTLIERRYDRALDFLLKLELQEFFELSGETSSFGGTMLKTMADVAQSDVTFQNTTQDENKVKGVIKGFST